MKKKLLINGAIGIITVVCILFGFNYNNNKRARQFESIVPIEGKPSIGIMLDNNNAKKSTGVGRNTTDTKYIVYEYVTKCTDGQFRPISIYLRYIDRMKNNEFMSQEYLIDGQSVNSFEFLRFMYNYNANNITKEDLSIFEQRSIDDAEFNKLRVEAGYDAIPLTNNTKIVENTAIKAPSIKSNNAIRDKAIKIESAEKINNPDKVLLAENIELDTTNLKKTVMLTKCNHYGIESQIRSKMTDVTIEPGVIDKNNNTYNVFVEGKINSVFISVRFYIENNNLYLYDSPIDMDNTTRIKAKDLKEILFNKQ